MAGTLYCAGHTRKPGAPAPAPDAKPKEKKPWWSKWYHRVQWKNLRLVILHRDPVCKKCQRYPSTIVDHIKPHKGNWQLFCDPKNLAGMCASCHDEKTASEDGGFGNPGDSGPAAIGTPAAAEGKLFNSTSVGEDALDAALAAED